MCSYKRHCSQHISSSVLRKFLYYRITLLHVLMTNYLKVDVSITTYLYKFCSRDKLVIRKQFLKAWDAFWRHEAPHPGGCISAVTFFAWPEFCGALCLVGYLLLSLFCNGRASIEFSDSALVFDAAAVSLPLY